MGKLWAILDLFRKGSAVANPEIYKNRAVALSLLVPCILAAARVAHAFGVDIVVTEADAASLAAGIVTVVCIVSTIVTSEKVGLPAKPASDSADRPVEHHTGLEP